MEGGHGQLGGWVGRRKEYGGWTGVGWWMSRWAREYGGWAGQAGNGLIVLETRETQGTSSTTNTPITMERATECLKRWTRDQGVWGSIPEALVMCKALYKL